MAIKMELETTPVSLFNALKISCTCTNLYDENERRKDERGGDEEKMSNASMQAHPNISS